MERTLFVEVQLLTHGSNPVISWRRLCQTAIQMQQAIGNRLPLQPIRRQAMIGRSEFAKRNQPLLENMIMDPLHPDDIVRLASAANPVQAHIWEQALTEEGIRCKVVGDYLDASLGDMPGFRAEVWVHRDDLARAEAILREGEQEAGKTTEEVEEVDESAGEPSEEAEESVDEQS
jgi:hypothetical protein